MRVPALLLLCVALLSSGSIAAQAPAEWHDDLVDHLAGTWVMSGNVMGKDAHHKVQADWILNHQFLRVHEKTSASAPKGERPYEAFWFLGYDPDKKQYVMHLMDVYGGTYSETLGYGTRDGDQIRFLFDYPDGPFRTVYRWNAAADTLGVGDGSKRQGREVDSLCRPEAYKSVNPIGGLGRILVLGRHLFSSLAKPIT